MIEYADRNKLDGAKLSYRKAMLRAEIAELEKVFEELKASKGNKGNNARRPPTSRKKILQSF